MDGASELAKLFKERDNQSYMGSIVGTVLAPPPDIKIQIDKNIILNKDNLVIGASMLKEYKRRIIIRGERIKFRKNNPVGETEVSSSHSHPLKYVDVDSVPVEIDAKAESSYIETTDTIKKGDKVILVPSKDEQTYFLIDWAVRL